MIRQEGTRPTPSGSTIYYQQWIPENRDPRAIIVLVHGFGEYTELYRDVAGFFVSHDYAMFAMDLRGHGRSPGARGFIRAWRDYREDVETLIELVGAELPRQPVFLLGNSMGGLIAIEYALQHPEQLTGLVAMSPAIGKLGVAKVLLLLSRLLSRIWPSFSLDTGIDSGAMTRDATIAARLDADPMVHGRGTARLGTEVTDTIIRVRARADELLVPVLIQHGEADTITSPADSRWFFEQVGSRDKELKLYPGSYHNLCVDLNWREVLSDVDGWIRGRLLRR
jgi:alpha-beta hydrolase superfamily lysophospholipase